MVRAARRQDDGEYVTKGEFREAIEKLATKDELQQAVDGLEDRLGAKIAYTNKLNELILDRIHPNWRNEDLPPDRVSG